MTFSEKFCVIENKTQYTFKQRTQIISTVILTLKQMAHIMNTNALTG